MPGPFFEREDGSLAPSEEAAAGEVVVAAAGSRRYGAAMDWLAHTSFADLKPGAVFVLMSSPAMPGAVLRAGDDLHIVKSDGTHIPTDVLESSPQEIVAEVPGARFRMTPRQEGDVDPFFQTRLPHQVWVAREVELI